jgi:hypothetical protein
MRGTVILVPLILALLIPAMASGNQPPADVRIEGIPDDGRIENPLNASVSYTDPDGDIVSIRWLLDGEEVATGPSIQRYVYPGKHNLTVELDDGNGSVVRSSRILDPVPPPGWGDEPDNRRNELIFWAIFGSGGLIFATAVAWIWLKRDNDGNRG